LIRGLYTSASGMVSQMNNLNAISNNLANVDLTGYKRDVSTFKAFPELLLRRMNDDGVINFPFGSVDAAPIIGKLGTGVEFNELYTIFEQGAMKQTDNPFDMALDGKGFFSIQVGDEEKYTRNGSFLINDESFLVTKDGHLVLGENGPIQIKENNFVIDENGVIYQNSTLADDPTRLVSLEENEWDNMEVVDRLKIVSFRENRMRYLKKTGNSFWIATEQTGPAEIMEENRPKVRTGFLEAANVNPVTEMVKMIEVNRTYEANQKMIQTEDSLLGKLINEAVRV
jgi:flagellar basal-body rod protein FlgF